MTSTAVNGPISEPDYDRLPYPSLPIAYTQPGSLAAMAVLFGAAPPDAARARVLELGCASGGNLIPLAVRFPEARFVGVDLSAGHVTVANERIAKLGIRNIDVRQGDISKARFEPGAFDFIVCHGVFSWVPRAVQDAIFRICSESLSPRGIAAVSYNVLPGWHLRRIIRDILLFHADPKSAPAERVARARKALSEIAGTVAGASPYATLLRSEAQRLAKAPSAYILGEFLVDHNAPCYFSEFTARASQSGLSYLCDGELVTSLPDYFSPRVAKRVREMAGGNATALQQYTDFFTGRPFRRSLLVRTANAPRLAGSADPTLARHLHFAADLRRKAEPSKSGEVVYVDPKARPIRAKGPVSAAVLERLARAYPATQTFDALVAGAKPAGADDKALDALMQLVVSEMATVSTVPLSVGRGDVDKPRAWSVARLDAASRQPWATGLHHVPVKLTAPVAYLLPHLTGTADRAALSRVVADALAQGKNGAAKPDEVLAQSLAYAGRNGLLDR